MIGLVGAHRTGKSTLCQALQEVRQGFLKEHKISISKMQSQLGYNSSNQSYDWETRKSIQSYLLSMFESSLGLGRIQLAQMLVRISERTPLDLIGYTVVNMPDNATQEDIEWVSAYTEKCIRLTNQYYSNIFLLQPGISYVECETSAKEDLMESLNAVYLRTFLDPRLTVEKHIVPADMLDLAERIGFVLEKAHV